MKTLDEKISSLKVGQSVRISTCNGITVTVERSSHENILRFVRTYPNGSWSVFKTTKS